MHDVLILKLLVLALSCLCIGFAVRLADWRRYTVVANRRRKRVEEKLRKTKARVDLFEIEAGAWKFSVGIRAERIKKLTADLVLEKGQREFTQSLLVRATEDLLKAREALATEKVRREGADGTNRLLVEKLENALVDVQRYDTALDAERVSHTETRNRLIEHEESVQAFSLANDALRDELNRRDTWRCQRGLSTKTRDAAIKKLNGGKENRPKGAKMRAHVIADRAGLFKGATVPEKKATRSRSATRSVK